MPTTTVLLAAPRHVAPPRPISTSNAGADRHNSERDRRPGLSVDAQRGRQRSSVGCEELKEQLRLHADDVEEPLLRRQALARLRLSVSRETVSLLKGPLDAAREAAIQAERDVRAFDRAVEAVSCVGRLAPGTEEHRKQCALPPRTPSPVPTPVRRVSSKKG